MSKVLVFCAESITELQTGILGRSLQIAHLLEKSGHEVSLASHEISENRCIGFPFLNTHEPAFSKSLTEFDILVCNGVNFAQTALFRDFQGLKVVDLIVPFFLEHENQGGHHPRRAEFDRTLLALCFSYGDLFLCGSKEQESLYTGLYKLLGKQFNQVPILCLPFTIRKKAIARNPSLKIAWIGGFYHWFEPEPFLRVLPDLFSEFPKLQVDFPGVEHPKNSDLSDSRELNCLKKLQKRFPDQVQILPWMPYEKYLKYLEDLRAAVVLHKSETEARFSIRTRIIELIELDIPVIASNGGIMSELLEDSGPGKVLAHNSQEVLKKSLCEILANGTGNHENQYKIPAIFLEENQVKTLKTALDQTPVLEKRGNPYLEMKESSLFYSRFRLTEILSARKSPGELIRIAGRKLRFVIKRAKNYLVTP